MTSKLTAIIDADFIRYAVACAGEKKSVIVTHRSSGRTKEFNNRTEFYGHHAKKAGGWLAELNANRTSPFTVDEFDFEDVSKGEPIQSVLHSCRKMYESAYGILDTKKHKGFIGKGESFRVGDSTILKYKGGRPSEKPMYLDVVSEYMEKTLKCEVVTFWESDDVCTIEAYNNPNHVVIAIDKDAYSQKTKVLNFNRVDEGIIDCNQFGKLWLDAKGDVRGYGEMFLAYQVAYGDDVDSYRANSATDTKWGSKSAYKKLVDCQNEKDLWQAVVDIYKHLYPEPKEIEGWRGDKFVVDAQYVLNENFAMARMLHWKDDVSDASKMLSNLGIEI